jgi:hypothetical protein
MSDPIAVDYASVSPLTDGERRGALHHLARLHHRAAPMPGALGFADLIEMLGLTETAAEFVAERRALSSPHPDPTDATTADSAPEAPRLCHKQLHDMAVHGRQRRDNGRWWCSGCAAVTQKRNRQARKDRRDAA